MFDFGMGIGNAIKAVADIVDDVWTSPEEELKIALSERKIDASVAMAQIKVNETAAKHRSIFVAGGRPFLIWVCGTIMAYQYIGYSSLEWIFGLLQAYEVIPVQIQYTVAGVAKTLMIKPPPQLDFVAIVPIMLSLLGLGGMRMTERIKGVAINSIRKP